MLAPGIEGGSNILYHVRMKVHLIDGTYELFRHYFAVPKSFNSKGQEIGATRGVLVSMFSLLEGGATHIAIATDHIVESFRNQLWESYKDSSGVPADLLSQFELLEDSLEAAGFQVWPMVEYEADDALASGAAICAKDPRVEKVLICTPDKDLAQCVTKDRVVQFDRRKRIVIDYEGVIKKFGVEPESIPDYLALVGDSADGYPGLPGWGARSSATVLFRYKHLENIPKNAREWKVSVRSPEKLCATLNEFWDKALLFRLLATLITDGPVKTTVVQLQWKSPTNRFPKICDTLKAPELAQRADSIKR
jgi:5'-3' exonuclease